MLQACGALLGGAMGKCRAKANQQSYPNRFEKKKRWERILKNIPLFPDNAVARTGDIINDAMESMNAGLSFADTGYISKAVTKKVFTHVRLAIARQIAQKGCVDLRGVAKLQVENFIPGVPRQQTYCKKWRCMKWKPPQNIKMDMSVTPGREIFYAFNELRSLEQVPYERSFGRRG